MDVLWVHAFVLLFRLSILPFQTWFPGAKRVSPLEGIINSLLCSDFLSGRHSAQDKINQPLECDMEPLSAVCLAVCMVI